MRRATESAGARVEAPLPGDFRALYAEHFGFVWRCLRALGVPESGLDDAAQEVFLVVHRRFEEFRGDARLRTWLYAIVRNIAANARRSSRRKGALYALDDAHPSPDASPDRRAEERELGRFIVRFVDGLDEKQRDVFVLVLLEELSVPEVAASLSVPLNTVYTRVRTVRQAFQRALEKRGDDA